MYGTDKSWEKKNGANQLLLEIHFERFYSYFLLFSTFTTFALFSASATFDEVFPQIYFSSSLLPGYVPQYRYSNTGIYIYICIKKEKECSGRKNNWWKTKAKEVAASPLSLVPPNRPTFILLALYKSQECRARRKTMKKWKQVDVAYLALPSLL